MFFKNAIDNKPIVSDPNNNQIVNLPLSPFTRNVEIENYRMKRVPSDYVMRPDLIALIELGDANKMEYIMMFNQIGNPFSIDEDDVLLIPDVPTADTMMIPYSSNAYSSPSDSSIQDILVQNYYKFAGREYVDMSSYQDFLEDTIPSGNTEPSDNLTSIPYLLNDNEEALVVRNGKVYFNNPNDNGLQDDIANTDIDKTIADILNNVSSDLGCENCSYNGTSLSDFIKAINKSDK